MTAVNLSPLFNEAQQNNNGQPLSGGLLSWYIAGTSTPAAVYKESTGSTLHTNPVVLTSRGEVPAPLWLQAGVSYKAMLTDSIGNIIRIVDNITGINDVTLAQQSLSEWIQYPGSPTFVNSTTFSVTGDATNTLTVARRFKTVVTAGATYGGITASTYSGGVTTVTVVTDGGFPVLDSGLGSVFYGFMDPTYPSFDTSGTSNQTKGAIQNQTYTAFLTAGTPPNYMLTPVPAIASYVQGMRFTILFHASGTSPTISISGLSTQNIKQYRADGSKNYCSPVLGVVSDIVYDGVDFILMDQLPIDTTNIVYTTGSQTLTGQKTFDAAAPPKSKNFCKAWALWYGSSLVVSSQATTNAYGLWTITKTSLGHYTFTFDTSTTTNDITNSNYVIMPMAEAQGSHSLVCNEDQVIPRGIGSFSLKFWDAQNNTYQDPRIINIAIFGN